MRPRGPRLVGRDAELATLEGELRAAMAGEGRGVLLVGEPGVGKTRLAGELAARHSAEVMVLSARAHVLGGTTAFGLWAEALERQLRTMPADEIARLCQGFLDDLAGLLRSVAAVRGRVPDGDVPRARLLEGLAVVMANLAADAPVVVVLDDLHLADASSLEALHYVTRGCTAVRMLVVATARPAELAEAPVAIEMMDGLEQDGLWRRLDLGPLPPAAQGELAEAILGAAPTPGLLAWLDERAGGNPLFAIGLLHAALDEGADLSAPRLSHVPDALASRVASRLRRLDDRAIALMELLAVLGRRVELRSLVGFFDGSPGELAALLERLGRAGLVAEEERGRELTYEVAHPLVAEAIYEAIGAARRRTLHRAAGRVLHSAGRLGEAAPHLVRAAEPGDDEAIGVLVEAAASAEAGGAFPEAFAILSSLGELLSVDDDRWLKVADALSWRPEWLDHRSDDRAYYGVDALRGMDRAMRQRPDLGRRATVRLHLGAYLAWAEAEVPDGKRLCQEAVALFEEAGDVAGALRAENELAWTLYLDGGFDAGRMLAEDVARRARLAGDEAALARAKQIGAMLLGGTGREQAEAQVRAALEADRIAGRRRLVTSSTINLAIYLAGSGRGEEARDLLEAARAESPDWRATNLPQTGPWILWMLGDYTAGLEWARPAQLLNQAVLAPRRGIGLASASLCAAERDDRTLASRCAERAHSAFRDRPWSMYSAVSPLADAVNLTHDRRHEAAFVAFRAASERMMGWGGWSFAAFSLVEMAEAAGRAGATGEAVWAEDRLLETAAGTDVPVIAGFIHLGATWRRVAAADRAGAAETARQAAGVFSGFSLPAMLGRSLMLLGHCTDDRSEATESLSTAVGLFESCGAVWRRREALEALSALGREGRRAADRALGAGSLSRREQDVARLAVEGLSARQIGQRLFIGERTVENHLARVYAKLHVSGRLELARRAREFGFDV